MTAPARSRLRLSGFSRFALPPTSGNVLLRSGQPRPLQVSFTVEPAAALRTTSAENIVLAPTLRYFAATCGSGGAAGGGGREDDGGVAGGRGAGVVPPPV